MMDIKQTVQTALMEDLNNQKDITALLIAENKDATACVITREDMILCGVEWAKEVFLQLDRETVIKFNYQDGDFVKANSEICTISGKARTILTGERTALNFLQMLSATASITNKFVAELEGTDSVLLDTRKTIPALRAAQKYAVKCGGGKNHRMGLYDAFLIKENHIAACVSIAKAVEKARQIAPDKPVEVEVENISELEEALLCKADIIMLDNFDISQINQAIELNAGRAKLEVSGDVNLDNIREIALTGVDYISCGSLTKHVIAINLSMRVQL